MADVKRGSLRTKKRGRRKGKPLNEWLRSRQTGSSLDHNVQVSGPGGS